VKENSQEQTNKNLELDNSTRQITEAMNESAKRVSDLETTANHLANLTDSLATTLQFFHIEDRLMSSTETMNKQIG
jgi:methyl-accepting chemotaxis protein